MKKLFCLALLLLFAAVSSADVTKNYGPGITKDLGPGAVTATVFLHVAVSPGHVASATVTYQLETNDGTVWNVQAGTSKFVCANDANGVTAAPKPSVAPANEAGVSTVPATLLVSMSFTAAAVSGGCDFKIANAAFAGTPTVNLLSYTFEALGGGAWSVQ